MVVWSSIQSAISKNTERTHALPEICLKSSGNAIDHYPLPAAAPVSAPVSVPAPLAAPAVPVPPAPIAVPVPPAPIAAPVLPAPIAIPVPPAPIVAPVLPAPAPPPPTKGRTIDPIVLGIEESNPLYMAAAHNTRRTMECEEAQAIEARLSELYKGQGGRSRGWVKTSLDTYMQPRAASGGDLVALDRAKKGFAWQLVRTDKVLSAFLDFLCVAKQIRVVVWFEDENCAVLYPAADATDLHASPPLYHVNERGQLLHRMPTSKELLDYCKEHRCTLYPPQSILNSFGHLTVPELDSVASRLGMPTQTGTKAERVAAIAIETLRQRLIAG